MILLIYTPVLTDWLLESRYREIGEHEPVASEKIFAAPECAIGFIVIGLAFRFIAHHSSSRVDRPRAQRGDTLSEAWRGLTPNFRPNC